jgi:succinyl-diaminopimelate desuccinylase
VKNHSAIDPIDLAARLVRCPSVTPAEGGALGLLQEVLEPLGFDCQRLKFSDPDSPQVENLYARIGSGPPHFCFAGHTDVVPVGDAAAWSVDPFAGEIREGRLWGRGACDMKGAIASFVAAAGRFLEQREDFSGSLSLLITGDEEGPAVNGTKKVLEWLRERNETIDACLVGEPTNAQELGDTIKIGRRGSLSGWLTVPGRQGHTAYPQLADNPIPRLVRMLAHLTQAELDQGNAHFQPSTIALTSVDVGNPAANVIPAEARAAFNIRFNDEHTGAALENWLRAGFDAVGGAYELEVRVSGEAFLTPPGAFSELLAGAIETSLGRRPELGTAGGTSDARFIRGHAPVAEFGLVGQSMHQVDENTPVAEIQSLARAYQAILEAYFAT